MKLFHCRTCDRIISQPYGLCRVCINRKSDNNLTMYKSESKEQRFDKNGNPICIICGAVVQRLSGHLRVHNISVREYKKKFNLKLGTRLANGSIVNDEYKEQRKQRMIEFNKKRENKRKLLDSNTNMYYNGSESDKGGDE